MLNLISRAVGLAICLGLMAVGAKHTGKELLKWKRAHDQRKNAVTKAA